MSGASARPAAPASPPAAVRSVTALAARLARQWWPHLAALACASGVVATTIAGALGVGAAMQQGLRRLALARLGGIRAAVLSDAGFPAAVADATEGRLRSTPGGSPGSVVPAFIAEVSCESPERPAPVRATLLACADPRALGFAAAPGPLARDAVAVNDELAAALGAAPGAAVVLRMAKVGDVPVDSPLGRRAGDSWSRRLRLEAVLPAAGIAQFALKPAQVTGPLAVVSLETVQALLRREEPPANALLLVADAGSPAAAGSSPVAVGADDAAAALERAFRPSLADLGLDLAPSAGGAAWRLTSRRLLLPPAVDRAAAAVLGPLGGRPSLAFLANAMTPLAAGRPGAASIPYSTVVGVDAATLPAGDLVDDDGRPLPLPGADEIVIDRWMADDLAAQGAAVAVGDGLEIRFFLPETLHGRVEEAARTLRIAGIAAMRGAAVERDFVPEVQGVTDEASIADWDPPFPFDRGRVRATPPHDEDDRYWKEHGATPKAFVSLALAREIAGSRFGDSTAWHVPAARVASADGLRAALAAAVRPADVGLAVVPLARQAEAAARGSTPFGSLFLALSSFVVGAGLLLEWLLFALLIAARRRDVGLLAAIGWPPRRVAGLLVLVGGMAAAAGICVGTAVGPLWAGVLLDWLAGAWQTGVARGSAVAFGTPRDAVAAVDAATLLPGAVAAAAVSLAALAFAARRAAGLAPLALLKGSGDVSRPPAAGRLTAVTAFLAPAAAVLMAWLGRAADAQAAVGLFFGAGMAALAGLLAVVRLLVDRRAGGGRPVRTLLDLAWRELGAGRSRAFSVAAIVAVAEFLIVAVSSFALHPPTRPHDRGGPTGGWTFIASFATPTGVDPADPVVRESLGLSAADRRALDGCTIARIRSSAGDDASCTNLYAPATPTVLGLGPAFLERGGFRFVDHAPLSGAAASPWSLLDRSGSAAAAATAPKPAAATAAAADPVIPAILDQATAQWALKLGGVGAEFTIDADGRPARLRIVGLLEPGILQGYVLVAENDFARLFPRRSGYGMALVDDNAAAGADAAAGPASGDGGGPAAAAGRVDRAIGAAWADAGVTVTRATDRLARLQAVQNTFLSGFQALGTLGLVLGTAGVAAVQFQGVLERLGSLALLSAVGFTAGRLRRLVVVETLLMVALGLVAGTLAGCLALVPAFLAGRAGVPVWWIAGTWTATLAAAVVAGLTAARRVARIEPRQALAAGE